MKKELSLSDLKQVYFLGIGGIGMSAIARWFLHNGFPVAGYDKTESPLTKKLAEEGSSFVHSAADLEKAIQASAILFGNATSDDLKQLDEATFLEVFDGVPQATISRNEIDNGIDIVSVLNEKTGFFKSNGEARRALSANSIAVNKEKVTEEFSLSNTNLINNQFVLLQSGKKNYFVIRLV